MIRNAWLKWSWRYGSLTVDSFDTFRAAVGSAAYASDFGSEAFSHIEGPEGVVDSETVSVEWNRIKATARSPVLTYRVEIGSLRDRDEGRKGAYSWHISESDANKTADELRAVYGDRVTVKSTGWK